MSKWSISMTLHIPKYGKKGLYALYYEHMQRQQGLQGVYLAHLYHLAPVSDHREILPQFGVECILRGHNELWH